MTQRPGWGCLTPDGERGDKGLHIDTAARMGVSDPCGERGDKGLHIDTAARMGVSVPCGERGDKGLHIDTAARMGVSDPCGERGDNGQDQGQNLTLHMRPPSTPVHPPHAPTLHTCSPSTCAHLTSTPVHPPRLFTLHTCSARYRSRMLAPKLHPAANKSDLGWERVTWVTTGLDKGSIGYASERLTGWSRGSRNSKI